MRIGIDARKIGDYGIGTYIRGLLAGLAECREEERYVVFAPARHRALIPAGHEHVPLDAANYSIGELLAVGRAAGAARLDHFHAPHYVVPIVKLPVVVTIHDLIHWHNRNPVKRGYARVMLRRAARRAARVLTVTDAVKDEIVATLTTPAANVTVIPNGVNDVFRAAEPKRHPSRYFLYAGNDKPHKNVPALVEAFSRVRREKGDLSLVLAGAPFDQFQGRDGVICRGFVAENELAALYRDALALVQPSLEEGFGLPAAEAMASGTAVITSRAAALVEITGDAALHVESSDVGSLAGALRLLASDENVRVSLARRGIARAAAFTWRRCAEETRRVYGDVLQRS